MNEQGIWSKQHPLVHFFFALVLAGIGLLLSTVLSFIILFIQTGSVAGMMNGLANADINTMVFLQLLSQLMVFILPAFVFSYLVNKNPFNYYHTIDKTNVLKYVIALICIFSAAIFIQSLTIDKATFVFPKSLHFFETLAKTTQENYDSFVAKLLTITNPLMLILVFIMVAVMPAIGEELLFRGMLQESLEKGFKNRWVAIFISGILFGIIHFEFYNFFALCFMGFVLGYIYSITKNIYITILMHFINNGTALIVMILYKKNMITMNPDDKAPIYVVIGGGILMLITCFYYWKNKLISEENKILNEES